MQVSASGDRDVIKRVLVGVEGINRPVTYSGSNKDLENAIIKTFSDRLHGINESDKELIIEIKDAEWDGLFVQLIDQVVADKSVLRARIVERVCIRAPTSQAVSCWILRG